MGNPQINRGQELYLQECNNNLIHNNNNHSNNNNSQFNKTVLLIGQNVILVCDSDLLFQIIQVNKIIHHNMDNIISIVNIVNIVNTISIINMDNMANMVNMDIFLLKVYAYSCIKIFFFVYKIFLWI